MVKVSVQIPAYNSARFLPDAIESVLAQTYKNYEIIVVDDGSTDNTKEVLRPYMDKIRYFYHENKGISRTRNRALKEAKGEYIAFLDADDMWLPHRLESQVPVLEQNPELAFVSGATQVMDEDGNIYKAWKKGPGNTENLKGVMVNNFIFILTVLARKAFIENVGGFDVHFRCSNDYDMWLRLARNHPFKYLDDVVAVYREHSGGISKNTALQLNDKLRIMSKPEISGDLNFFQKNYLKSLICYNRALQCGQAGDYKGMVYCYHQALIRNPFIGADFWPDEAVGKRWTLPYRILKPYYLLARNVIKAILKIKVNHESTPFMS